LKNTAALGPRARLIDRPPPDPHRGAELSLAVRPSLLRSVSRSLSLALPLAALAGSARGAAPEADKVVELPPLIVTESTNPLEWRYAAAPGLEVLSVCPDATTRAFLEQFYRLRQLLQLVLPADLQVGLSVPVVHILGGNDMRDRLKQDVQQEMFQNQAADTDPELDRPAIGRGGALATRLAPRTRVAVLPNLRLQDTDAYTIFALLDDSQLQNGQLGLTPDYVNFLMQRRAPPLPAWFILGVMRLYPTFVFEARQVELTPLAWTSHEASEAVRKNPATALLPMADLVAAPQVPAGPPELAAAYHAAWIAQATLFVRWALDDRNLAREGFFKFVNRASSGPVTAALFQECFGMDYAAMRERLGRYLPDALDKTIRLRPAGALESPDLKLRPATPAEVARIKGDWERMETGFVKRTYPALSGKYLDEARRTLHRAYDVGERDSRLLAALGLCECDAGDDAAAEPFLAAAVRARVARPRAYVEWARILYERARAKPAGPNGKLSAAQTAPIVESLLVAQRLSPPQADGAEIFADLWFHTEVTPLPSDLDKLNQETGFFPRSLSLGYRTALLDAQAARWPEARGLVVRGIATAPTPAARDRFVQLEGLLPSAAP
jgi:hypothetical protein